MNACTKLGLAAIASISLHCIAICQETSPTGNWDVSFWISSSTGEENTNSFSEAQILSSGVYVGRIFTHQSGTEWWHGTYEYGISISPLFVQFRPQVLHGIAFEPVNLRWQSNRRLWSAVPYIELAGGAVRTNLNLPAGDTSNFNFTARGGGGVSLPSHGKHAVDIGAFWSHISNANLGSQNPEFNGVEVRFAYHWFR